MTMQFYSARNQIVVIVDDPKHGVDGMYRCDNTCVLFQANDDCTRIAESVEDVG